MADRHYLDETGLRLYDAKLKTYITDQMDKALEEVMENFSQGMKIMGTIEPKSDEIEMDSKVLDPSVGHTYIFKVDMSQYKDGVTIRYYDGDGDLVSETARNNDTITCIKEREKNPSGTSPAYFSARWALLAGNWDFDAPDSTPVLDLGALPQGETKKHISLGVLNGTDLGFDVPTDTEVAEQVGTALTEGGFVKIDSYGTLSNATNVISDTEPQVALAATDKAVFKFVHTNAETLNPSNGGTTITINADLNTSLFCQPNNWYASAALAETVKNAPWGDKKAGAPSFVLRVLKLSDNMTERTIVAEDGMRYVQKVTTTNGTTTYGNWQAVTLEGVTGIGVEPYDDTVGLNLYTAGNSEPNEIEIAPATQVSAGVMSADDKKKLDNNSVAEHILKHSYTATVGQLKEKLREWFNKTKESPNAVARVDLNILEGWEKDDNETVKRSQTFTFKKIASYNGDNFFTLLVSTYDNKALYTVTLRNGVWGSLEKIAYKTDTISATGQNHGVKVQLGGTLGSPTVTVTNEFGEVNVSNSSYAVSGREVAKNVPLLIGANGMKIPSGADLNSDAYCDIGTYCADSYELVRTLQNCPTNTVFRMFVAATTYHVDDISTQYASRIRQIVDYNGNEWVQKIYNPSTGGVATFEEWRKVLRNDTYFTPYSSGSAGVGGAVKAPQTADENKKFLRGDGTWGREADATNTSSGLMSAADKVYLDSAITADDYYGEDIGMEEDLYGYGVEFDTGVSSPTCTRIGNMEMHRRLPVHSKMRGCLLDDQGIVQEYLPAGSWKSSTRNGSIGQVMVEIPEHYRKFVTNGTKRQVWYSVEKISGYHKVPKMYISAYEATVQRSTGKLCSVVNTTADYRGGNNNSAYDNAENSLLGTSATQISRTNFRTYARNRNVSTTNWNIMTYDAYKSLYWLFVVEYATLDSQRAFEAKPTSDGFKQGGLGAGVTNINSEKWNTFNGYHPFIKCGYTDSLGNGTGIVEYTTPANLGGVTVQVPRYRGIENPFGHLFKWIDGIIIQINPDGADGSAGLSKIYTCSDPDKFTDSEYTGYTYVGNEARTEAYVQEVIFGDQGEIMPSSVGGGSTTYFCDYHHTNIPTTTTLRGVLFGGHAAYGSHAGFVSAYSSSAPSHTYAAFGSRLCFIPS